MNAVHGSDKIRRVKSSKQPGNKMSPFGRPPQKSGRFVERHSPSNLRATCRLGLMTKSFEQNHILRLPVAKKSWSMTILR
jgi:hypothetical protein